MINYDDFAKVEMQIGTILSCEPVEKSEKLLKLEVDFGTEKRQILSGIAKYYSPDDLVGKQAAFVTNLESREMMGLESQGMILATGTDEKIVLMQPAEEVPNGSKLG